MAFEFECARLLGGRDIFPDRWGSISLKDMFPAFGKWGDSACHACRYDSVPTHWAAPAPALMSACPPHFPARRATQFMAGRLCARAALIEAGCPADNAWIGRDAETGRPVWPHDFSGSISHSRGVALAMAARTLDHGSIGIDLQKHVSRAMASALLPMVLAQKEQNILHQKGLTDVQAVTLAFSAKEALYKALHPDLQRWIYPMEAIIWHSEENTLFLSQAQGAQRHAVSYLMTPDGVLSWFLGEKGGDAEPSMR